MLWLGTDVNTVADTDRLRCEVSRLGLSGRERVLALSSAALASAYNGTGPEFLPARIREKLDDLADPFLPAVMVHDVDYTFSDGTISSFRAANIRILVNCIKCAVDAEPWYSLRRYALIIKAVTIYRACNRFGWIAWRSAYHKQPTTDNQQP